jgi:hypothetical protein
MVVGKNEGCANEPSQAGKLIGPFPDVKVNDLSVGLLEDVDMGPQGSRRVEGVNGRTERLQPGSTAMRRVLGDYGDGVPAAHQFTGG